MKKKKGTRKKGTHPNAEGLSETGALAAVYHSSFYDRLADARSGLCTDSTASLVHLFLKERRARPAT